MTSPQSKELGIKAENMAFVEFIVGFSLFILGCTIIYVSPISGLTSMGSGLILVARTGHWKDVARSHRQ